MLHTGSLRILSPNDLNDRGVRAGFSLRHGGASPAPFHSLNLGLSTGDAAENVHENRKRLFATAGLPLGRLAIAGQVHGKEVLTIGEPGLFPGYDALVTNVPDLVLCITSADCAVVLLADHEAGVVGACHSGWRGTVQEVAIETIAAMQALGAQPPHLRAYISPCISTEHFEVGREVADQFDPQYVVERDDWPRPHVDLKQVIGDQLVRCGVNGDAIEISPRCTFGETDDFFSYRAETGETGRMMGFISLTNHR